MQGEQGLLHLGSLGQRVFYQEMNINTELFKHGGDKRAIIESLTKEELLRTTPDTIKRIVKEAGTAYYQSRNKKLYIPRELRTGNSWNSEFEGVSLIKGKLKVHLYVQYSNTDITKDEDFSTFLSPGSYEGSIIGSDNHGNSRHYYFTYNDEDKARAIKSILLTYITSEK